MEQVDSGASVVHSPSHPALPRTPLQPLTLPCTPLHPLTAAHIPLDPTHRCSTLRPPHNPSQVLYREIDFDNERQAAEEFGNNFKDIPQVKVPCYPSLSSEWVVSLE